mgnify:CR=1 FL=1
MHNKRASLGKIMMSVMVFSFLAGMLALPARSSQVLWTEPEYYETIQTGDIDGDGAAELLVRSSLGLFTYRFNTGGQVWEPVYPGDLAMSDSAGWTEPQYYETIQTADIDGDGAAELLVRGANGLLTYRFKRQWSVYLPVILSGHSPVSTQSQLQSLDAAYSQTPERWELVPASGLGMGNDEGWDLPEHYSAIQTGDIDGDGAAELLARYGDGLHAFRFNTDSQDWDDVPASPLGMGNAEGWDQAEHYSTIQTGDIDGDGAAELLERYGDGLHVFRFNTGSQDWDDVPESRHG